MRPSQAYLMQPSQTALLRKLPSRLVTRTEFVFHLVHACEMVKKPSHLPTTLQELINALVVDPPSPTAFEEFCVLLLASGHFSAFFCLRPGARFTRLKELSLPSGITQFLNPLFLRQVVHASPALTAKLQLRKFRGPEMPADRRKLLRGLQGVLVSMLSVEPVLAYCVVYELLTPDTADRIQNISDGQKRVTELLDAMVQFGLYAVERLAHALVLSEQWKLFYVLSKDIVLDVDVLENMSKIHFDILCAVENVENVFPAEVLPNNGHRVPPKKLVSISFGDEDDDDVEMETSIADDDENVSPRPSGLLDIEVTETDSATLESIYHGHEHDVYRNFSSPKGLALIINNKKFAFPFNTRDGSDVDEENISRQLKKLGYRVELKCKNLSAEGMLERARTFAKHPDHDYLDSCVVVVMTHGRYDLLIGADGEELNIHAFLACFNSSNAPGLRGKPKLFFIQACRGEHHDHGIASDTTDVAALASIFACMKPAGLNQAPDPLEEQQYLPSPSRKASVAEQNASRLPLSPNQGSNPSGATPAFPPAVSTRGTQQQRFGQRQIHRRPTETDMIIAFSTTAHYVSWRNSVEGSWFIQTLCEVFSEHAATSEICDLLRMVNQRVGRKYANGALTKGCKQTTEFVHRLSKKFYFFPGIVNPPSGGTAI